MPRRLNQGVFVASAGASVGVRVAVPIGSALQSPRSTLGQACQGLLQIFIRALCRRRKTFPPPCCRNKEASAEFRLRFPSLSHRTIKAEPGIPTPNMAEEE